MLSGEFATNLSGRYFYMEYWGFPALLQYEDNEAKDNYIKSTYDSVVLHDILERSKIGDYDFLEKLRDFLIINTGQMYWCDWK